jgi:hypothetical protein
VEIELKIVETFSMDTDILQGTRFMSPAEKRRGRCLKGQVE